MSSGISVPRVCRFGLFEADLTTGILKRHGIPLKVQEQPFRILGFLLERPGEVVLREEIRRKSCGIAFGLKALSSNSMAA